LELGGGDKSYTDLVQRRLRLDRFSAKGRKKEVTPKYRQKKGRTAQRGRRRDKKRHIRAQPASKTELEETEKELIYGQYKI